LTNKGHTYYLEKNIFLNHFDAATFATFCYHFLSLLLTGNKILGVYNLQREQHVTIKNFKITNATFCYFLLSFITILKNEAA